MQRVSSYRRNTLLRRETLSVGEVRDLTSPADIWKPTGGQVVPLSAGNSDHGIAFQKSQMWSVLKDPLDSTTGVGGISDWNWSTVVA